MPTKHLLDVGNCQPDFSALAAFLTNHFDVQMHQAHLPDEALELVRKQRFDLVLVNRKLDADYSNGLDVLRRLKSDETTKHVPVMLVTNYANHQQLAVESGAELGFGKLEFDQPETRDRLAVFLD